MLMAEPHVHRTSPFPGHWCVIQLCCLALHAGVTATQRAQSRSICHSSGRIIVTRCFHGHTGSGKNPAEKVPWRTYCLVVTEPVKLLFP